MGSRWLLRRLAPSFLGVDGCRKCRNVPVTEYNHDESLTGLNTPRFNNTGGEEYFVQQFTHTEKHSQ